MKTLDQARGCAAQPQLFDAARALGSLGAAVVFLAMCLTTSGVAAQWVWTDARGIKTYSDIAPPNTVPDKFILVRPDQAARSAAGGASASTNDNPVAKATGAASAPLLKVATKDTELDRRKKEKEAADKQAAAEVANAEKAKEAAEKAVSCNNNKMRMAGLTTEGRVSRMNSKGEREVLTDEQRATELAKAKADQAANCS